MSECWKQYDISVVGYNGVWNAIFMKLLYSVSTPEHIRRNTSLKVIEAQSIVAGFGRKIPKAEALLERLPFNKFFYSSQYSLFLD